MLAAGTNIVGGVNARKAGTSVTIGGRDLTVFGTVEEAMKETGADVSVVFVPPRFAKDAVIEAIDAEIGLAVVITEGIPVHDSGVLLGARLREGQQHADHRPELPGDHLARASRTRGSSRPTSPGAGPIGLVSKSGTLTYQMMYELREYRVLLRDRDRWRPGDRDHPHRRAGGVRGRPGDRGDRDDR